MIDGQARQIARMIPGAAEKVEVTPEIAKRIVAREGHLRRGDHPMTTAEGPAGSDAQVALLARRLQREPRAFREVFISDGMAAIAYEFQQPELGPEFTRALWATLLREDDSGTLMMRFLWDLPLGKKRTFIRAIDRELGERYPMFDGLSVDWPAGNSIPPYVRGADDRAQDFELVNKGYLGYMDLGYTAREVDLFVWLEAMRDKQCAEKPCELGIFLNECKEPTGGCPVQIHIPEMIELVGTGRFREALDLIESCNPLPDVTGRVCPQELQCQGVCLQNKMPIAIGQLEWFLPEREKLVNPGGDAARFAGHRDPWQAAVEAAGRDRRLRALRADQRLPAGRRGLPGHRVRGLPRARRRAALRHPGVPPAQRPDRRRGREDPAARRPVRAELRGRQDGHDPGPAGTPASTGSSWAPVRACRGS